MMVNNWWARTLVVFLNLGGDWGGGFTLLFIQGHDVESGLGGGFTLLFIMYLICK